MQHNKHPLFDPIDAYESVEESCDCFEEGLDNLNTNEDSSQAVSIDDDDDDKSN